MKANKILTIFIIMLLVILAGCSNGIKNEGNKIIVEKQVNVNGVDKYKLYNEIKNSKEVQNARDILNSIKWEDAKVDMANPPEYKFYFQDNDNKTSSAIYELWVNPTKDKIELVIESESKYVQLDTEKSKKLFKIITGKNLGEV